MAAPRVHGVLGTFHTRNADELLQRLTLTSSYEVSRRTRLLLSAVASQSTISNLLLTQPTGSTPITALPLANANLGTVAATQGIEWDASPRLLFTQTAGGSYVTSLDEDVPLTSAFANAGIGLEYLWKNDALGGDLLGGIARVDTPPLPQTTFYTVTAAPRWRHDWSDRVSTSLSGGATLVMSPEADQAPFVTPYGRASVLYTLGETNADLSYAGGVQPNVLSGQLLRAHQVTLRAGTPLSEHERVFLSGSIGFLRGETIVLDDTVQPPDFDAFLSDVDVSWLATDHLSVFGRYQFFGQFGGPGAQFLREALIFGITVATRPPDGIRIPTQFAQRVDRGDAAARR